MPFDPHHDPIALTVPSFRLKRPSLGEQGIFDIADWSENEPYLVSLAIAETGTQQQKLNAQLTTHPGIRPKDTVHLLGDGHLVYGPANPGAFVTVAVLLMESDRDTRRLGQSINDLVQPAVTELGLNTLLATQPTLGAAAYVIRELTALIGKRLADDRDDHLLTMTGTFLRDDATPYDVGQSVTHENAAAEMTLHVRALNAT